MRKFSWFAGSTLALFAAVGTAQAQVKFFDIGAGRGIGSYSCAPGMGGGVSAADVDGDGFVDMYIPQAEGFGNQYYHNNGDGSFTEMAAAAGIGSTMRSKSAVWFDYDGDAKLDLIVTGDCFDPAAVGSGAPCTSQTLILYHNNGNGTFTDVTAASGMPVIHTPNSTVHNASIAAADINNDGWLDVSVTVWKGHSLLMLNNGDGTFTDISASSGVYATEEKLWEPLFFDFNGDGLMDLYQNVDFLANHLWINNGDNTFHDIAPAAHVDFFMNDMGLAIGDYDNDGDFDLYATNVFGQQAGERNLLMRNDTVGGNVLFTEVGEAAGVANTSWGWGCTFMDADRDGSLDLAVTNGWFNPPYLGDASHFFYNNGDGTFSDISSTAAFNDTAFGSGLVAFDFDRDGDQDLVQTQNNGGALRLLENRRGGGRTRYFHLTVQPRQPGTPNYYAIGSIVRVDVDGANPIHAARYITAGTSHLSQEPAEAFFGVNRNRSGLTVTVEWPDGTSKVVTNVKSKQTIIVNKD